MQQDVVQLMSKYRLTEENIDCDEARMSKEVKDSLAQKAVLSAGPHQGDTQGNLYSQVLQNKNFG